MKRLLKGYRPIRCRRRGARTKHPSSPMIRTLSWKMTNEDATKNGNGANTPAGEVIGDPVVATDGDRRQTDATALT